MFVHIVQIRLNFFDLYTLQAATGKLTCYANAMTMLADYCSPIPSVNIKGRNRA